MVLGFVRNQGEFSAGFEMSLPSGNPECLSLPWTRHTLSCEVPGLLKNSGSCDAHVVMLFGCLGPVEWAGGCESVSISLAYLNVW